MGFADKLKDAVAKGKDAAAANKDKIEAGIDKAGDFIDSKTKGKYTEKIDKAEEAVKKVIPNKGEGE